jgi:hypothetical protein
VTRDAITALDYNSVLVCFQEFIVKNDCPLRVIHFSIAMCQEGGVRSLPTSVLCCEGLKGIRKLRLTEVTINEIECSYR